MSDQPKNGDGVFIGTRDFNGYGQVESVDAKAGTAKVFYTQGTSLIITTVKLTEIKSCDDMPKKFWPGGKAPQNNKIK